MKTKNRFSRNAVASSRGAYVRQSHIAYIKEQHEKNEKIITELSITIKAKPRYFVKCFDKMYQITEKEAAMLGSIVICM